MVHGEKSTFLKPSFLRFNSAENKQPQFGTPRLNLPATSKLITSLGEPQTPTSCVPPSPSRVPLVPPIPASPLLLYKHSSIGTVCMSSRQTVSTSSFNNDMAKWCMNQEKSNKEMQIQLDASRKELNALKLKLEEMAAHILHLQQVNQKNEELSRHLKGEEVLSRSEDADDGYCQEVDMQSLENGKTVEEVEDRQAWLSRLEEQQRESHDKRAEILQNEFQRKIEEKEAQLDCMRSNAEQLLTQVRDSSAERDLLKKQLKETQSELDRIVQEKINILEQQAELEFEFAELKRTFNERVNERVNKVVEELSQEQSRSQVAIDKLNEFRDQMLVTEAEHQKKISQMEEAVSAEQQQIVSLKEEINKLGSASREAEAELAAVRQEMASQQETLATLGDIKAALASVSKERATLQERFVSLEEQLKVANNALEESSKQKEELERSANELNRKYQDEIAAKENSLLDAKNNAQQLAEANQLIETKSKNINELLGQLSSMEERIRQVQELADERKSQLDGVRAEMEVCQQTKAGLDKEIQELKHHLIGNTIQLQYKEKKLAEMEEALNEMDTKAAEKDASVEMVRKLSMEVDTLKKTLSEKNSDLQNALSQLKEFRNKLEDVEKTKSLSGSEVVLLEDNAETPLHANMSGPHLNVTKTCEVALEQLDKVPPSDAEPQKDVFKVPIAACNSVPAITTPEKSILKKSRNSEHLQTLALIEKAEAKAEELKRLASNPPSMKKSMSPPNTYSRNPEKRRRSNTVGHPEYSTRSRSTAVKPVDLVPASPVLRNKSGVITSRPNKRPLNVVVTRSVPQEPMDFE